MSTPYLRTTLLLIVMNLSLTGLIYPQSRVKSAEIIQSTYYDALNLYYALHGKAVYPLEIIGSASLAEAKARYTDNPVPNRLFRLIESGTGKIVKDLLDENKVKLAIETLPRDEEAVQEVIRSVLARNAGLNENVSWEELHKVYQINPYFTLDRAGNLSVGVDKLANATALLGIVSNTTDGGGIVTDFAWGLSSLYVEMVNSELNDAFFVHLRKVLDKYEEIGVLFPATKEKLSTLKPLEFATSLKLLKECFCKDLSSISGNLTGLATLDRYRKLIDTHQELTLLFLALDFGGKIGKADPAEILQQVYCAPYAASTVYNPYQSAIQIAGLTSFAMRDIRIGEHSQQDRGWLNPKRIWLLAQDKLFYTLFIGLYAQNALRIRITTSQKDTVSFGELLMKTKDQVINGNYLASNFIAVRQELNSIYVTLNAPETLKPDKIKLAAQVASELIGFSELAAGIMPAGAAKDLRKLNNTLRDHLLPMTTHATELRGHLQSGEYTAAVLKADSILGIVFKEKIRTEAANKEHLEVIRSQFRKYGLFAAAVAEADSAHMKDVLKAFALPTGSSRIKKETSNSFGINSYVGVYHAWNSNATANGLPAKEFGITAPIGFIYSKGHFLGGSLSAYGGVLDIGAIFTYRVTSDQTLKSDIELSQIFSPSIGLIYGLPVISGFNIPLSIGANYQWGPRLNKVSESGNSVLPLLSRRFNVFLAVDLPILNFHTSRR